MKRILCLLFLLLLSANSYAFELSKTGVCGFVFGTAAILYGGEKVFSHMEVKRQPWHVMVGDTEVYRYDREFYYPIDKKQDVGIEMIGYMLLAVGITDAIYMNWLEKKISVSVSSGEAFVKCRVLTFQN